MRIAGLTGHGRTLIHIHDRAPAGAGLSVVVADSEDAPALDAAAGRGIPTEVVPDGGEEALLDALAGYEADLLCLEGDAPALGGVLDRVPTALSAHRGLLPAFDGDMPVADALDSGARLTGATVRVVTGDGGPIVTQEPVTIRAGDDRETLADRIDREGVRRAYTRAVRLFAEDRVTVEDGVEIEGDDGGAFPARRLACEDRLEELRYGENPHQDAALYADPACAEASVADAPQVGGEKGMSYTNYVDAEGALDLIKEFEAPAAAVIKHANPAGCAVGETLIDAYDRALSTDPMSAFGGIVALNRPCDVATAERIVESVKHVVLAPAYEEGALEALATREDMRVLEVGDLSERTEAHAEKPLVGGRLVQDRDFQAPEPGDLEVVTEREPTDEQVESMLFAWQVTKHVRSNAIVFASDTETVGIGAGQMSRVDAVRIAAMKADEHAEGKTADGGVMASDAFFPFPDGIERAAEAGIEAVIQPGGSINDDDVIAAADDRDMTMAFTGQRCFKH